MLWATLGASALPPAFEDDAGSAGDAGDSRGDALQLPDEGSYAGRALPTGPADWYALAASPGEDLCVEVSVEGVALANVTLALEPALFEQVTRTLLPGGAVRLGIASPWITEALLGIEDVGGAGPTGDYTFAVRAVGLGALLDGDGESGRDAGGDAASAVAVPGACFGGRLDPSVGDRVDTYVFEGRMGERVSLSAAQPGNDSVTLTLIAPSGVPAPTTGTDGVGEQRLTESGEWLVVITTTADVSLPLPYLVGITRGPEPPPCRPHCLALIPPFL